MSGVWIVEFSEFSEFSIAACFEFSEFSELSEFSIAACVEFSVFSVCLCSSFLLYTFLP